MLRLSIRCLFALAVDPGPSARAGTFEQKVLPLLRTNCVPCHDAKTHTSGFSIESLRSVVAGGARHGLAVKAGHPESSLLIELLRGTVKPQMPFGKALPATDIATIEAWIRESEAEIAAVTPKQTRWWAFVKPAMHDRPAARNAVWARNDIDYFILNRLEAKGAAPGPRSKPARC